MLELSCKLDTVWESEPLIVRLTEGRVGPNEASLRKADPPNNGATIMLPSENHGITLPHSQVIGLLGSGRCSKG